MIADAGYSLKFGMGPSKYNRYSKAHETSISALKNIILHISSKVYDTQNIAIGHMKHFQQTYQRCTFLISVQQYV